MYAFRFETAANIALFFFLQALPLLHYCLVLFLHGYLLIVNATLSIAFSPIVSPFLTIFAYKERAWQRKIS